MKNFCLSLLILTGSFLKAQLFTQINSGRIVNTPGDSRSVNLIDINNDGYDDVFITNGPSAKDHNLLYINNGNGTFSPDSTNAIVKDTSSFDGASFGDVDNDGDLDAYVVTWYGYKNFFYRNLGSGTYSYEPTTASGLLGTYSETSSWGDYNNDGLLDLYVTNSGGTNVNLLYSNVGAGTFTQVTTGAPATDANISRCVSWSDYDNDGDADLFVTNENNQKDDLYKNNGNGTFTKITTVPPAIFNKSTMTGSWADVDNDGDIDLFVGNSLFYAPENNQLFLNNGSGSFTSVFSGPIVTDGGCSYSSSFADYDNDGDIDLFVANGYCNGVIKHFLYNNNGVGVFARDTLSMPSYTTPCSYGCAWADLDHNGFQDIVIATCKNTTLSPLPNNMYFKNNGNGNKWIEINLTGTVSNKNAIGAKIIVTAIISGTLITQLREISAQTGYCSQNSMTAHFGLGNAAIIQSVQVKWPSGIISNLSNVPVDSILSIVEPLGTNITPYNKNSVKVNCFPNPVKDDLVVMIENPQKELLKEITIYNVTGAKIKTISVNSTEVFIKLNESLGRSFLDSGIYFLYLSGDKSRSLVKFVVD